ncbi:MULTISPECIES: DUF397 domain-containing protein [unclassified Streptomyces]|uniref:DUF397 domain-containing protein n=1 Tax=unclassified Streptomyces TaxID=2593676 RepID=UPI003451188F
MSKRNGPFEQAAEWRRSSYSGDANGQCVEFADVRSRHAAVALRDSKNVSGPALLVSPAAFTSFLTDLTGRS